MEKTEITINIPIKEVFEILKEKYNADDLSKCEVIIETKWVGDQREGWNEHTPKSIQIKYDQ